MPKKPAACLSLFIVIIVIACTNLAAQAPHIASPQHSAIIHRANGPDAGLTKIYSNLGSQTDAYDDGISYQITGPGNPLWGKGYLAMPFTPAKNFMAKEILMALGTFGGDDSATLAIFNDHNGVPAQPLKAWTAANFPQEGTCCQLLALKDPDGVPLRAGKQYWIVAGTGLGQDNSEYQWNFVWNGASGKVAFLNGNTNDQWLPYTDNVAAFAVYGVVH
jgi:hypothetical protein